MKGYSLSLNYKNIKFISEYIEFDVYNNSRRIRQNTPKTYKDIGGFIREHGTYESGCTTIYKNKNGVLYLSSYVDGCFYEFYYRIKTIKITKPYLIKKLSKKYKEHILKMRKFLKAKSDKELVNKIIYEN